MEWDALYTVATLDRTVPLDEFRQGLVDVPRFSGYCRDCPDYGQTWSCPPFGFDPAAVWEKYDAIRLYARKLVFAKDLLYSHVRVTRIDCEQITVETACAVGGALHTELIVCSTRAGRILNDRVNRVIDTIKAYRPR